MKYLVEHGADVNKRNNGETLIFIACRRGCEDTVKCLVEYGGKINKRNNNGESLIFCEKHYENIVKYLIEHRFY